MAGPCSGSAGVLRPVVFNLLPPLIVVSQVGEDFAIHCRRLLQGRLRHVEDERPQRSAVYKLRMISMNSDLAKYRFAPGLS
jgi:hypothetical protein